jgi:hypothetical protein
MTNQIHIIAAQNPAFGIEGETTYTGTALGAKRAANKIAREAGHNWTPIIKSWDLVKHGQNGSLYHSDAHGNVILRGGKMFPAEMSA